MHDQQTNNTWNIHHSIHEQIMIANIFYCNLRSNNNDITSLKRLREEAEDGNPWASVWLGCCYLRGITNDRASDIENGIKLLEKLVNFPLALFKLAEWYLEDETNLKKGKELLKKAADTGYVDANFSLGLHYIAGKVFKQNNSKAKTHLKLARALGHPDAHRQLIKLPKDSKSNKKSKVIKIKGRKK